MTYIKYAKDGSIEQMADWEFPDSVKVDFNVVRAYDGKFYREGTEPKKPQELIDKELFDSLRFERDKRLAETDYLIMPDYPISSDTLKKVKEYRQALRDITSKDGAPWDGKNTPWPVKDF